MWTWNLCFAGWFRMRVPMQVLGVYICNQFQHLTEAGRWRVWGWPRNLHQINGIRISQLSACQVQLDRHPFFSSLLIPCSHLPTSLPTPPTSSPGSPYTAFFILLPQLLKCWYFGDIPSCHYLVSLQNGLETVETHNQTFKHFHRSPQIFCFSFNSLGDS